MQNDHSEKTAAGWGGARSGAGRPRTTARSISIRVPEDVAAILDSLGRGKQAAYIVRAIRAYYQAGGE